jgi:hypothetical protein
MDFLIGASLKPGQLYYLMSFHRSQPVLMLF